MSAGSIVMMVLFLVIISGGLLASSIHLVRHPDTTADNDE
ncbi:MAG: methionine/alanine import family NSS transporter small subunit [Lawsonella clevelandensis]